jgi:hypothetical protein
MPHAPVLRKTMLAAAIPADLDHAVRVLAAVARKKLRHVMEAALHRYVDERRDLLSAPAALSAADASASFAPAAPGFHRLAPSVDLIALQFETAPEPG